MHELKNMSDKELALHMINYIERIQQLMTAVSEILKGTGDKYQIETVRKEYKSLKQYIKADARYLDLCANQRNDKDAALYSGIFKPCITEAAAWGFTAATNSIINANFYHSLEEALYKLIKHNSLDEWKEIANG